MEREFIDNKIKQAEIALNNDTMMIGFYEWLAGKESDKKKSADWKVKADQVKATKKFNEDFLEYAKTL